MAQIQPGSTVLVRDSRGLVHRKRATTGIVPGKNIAEVVWACREDEWKAALSEGRSPEAIPWPASDVEIASE